MAADVLFFILIFFWRDSLVKPEFVSRSGTTELRRKFCVKAGPVKGTKRKRKQKNMEGRGGGVERGV